MGRYTLMTFSGMSVWMSLVVVILSLISAKSVAAQAAVNVRTGEESSEVALSSAPTGVEQTHQGEVTSKPAVAVLPPFPFQAPQIGPLIKRSFADDVDKRTTAFIPQAGSLAELTPVETPEGEEKWIHVDLSEQMVVAYERQKPVRGFIISSGLPGTPTVQGEFRIRTKVEVQTMSGGSGSGYYNLPGVKWVQYFFEDYSFHGTYWHNDFGRPKSHGCVNMTNADAKWLFDWAGPKWDGESVWFKSTKENPGTLVIVTE